MAVKVFSKVIRGEVYVRCGDIIKSLYIDLAGDSTDEQKNYIRAQIELWEEYENDISIKAGQK